MAARKLYGESDDTYNKRNSMTGYTYKNAAEMEKVRDQYMNREDFKYDLGSDMLYQQARDQYKALGKMAMQDTIGRASSLTGGYANSYAASAGNQAYNQYLQALNENIPDYYAMALDAYDRAGNNLLNKYNIYQTEDSEGYSRYMNELNYLMSLAQAESSDAQANRSFDESKRQFDAQMAYQKERDAIADSQWQKNYELNLAAKNAAASEPAWTDEEFNELLSIYENDGLQQFNAALNKMSKAKGWDENIKSALDVNIRAVGVNHPLMNYDWVAAAPNTGGHNWGGPNTINNNAIVKYNGTEYRLDELYDEIKKTMGEEVALNYILNLQKSLEID
jgi:hypothetical protein|nr:MAG TPA: hypothetical protein [Caudoviricetes sp.]